ncbi:hypothetical protein PT179_07785 [Erysipelothrix rhusiopathiae]|uniref:ECs_2282 family putative zinc-binding protein n=1 Tax=Erysipelothrix rhusiopathiae TaxID=1648 RepID=UPI0023AEA8C5|nr:hypothetical protein [Erysipelothrix rhusiopathiae]MDE8055280.1 hypothetical protein [Erysipelothrix rhusiopathiae]MDE8092110.1 hypothetical protein [Erysipelothrix rhusiopathiae]MDE8103357.1 hypothetical protein [Erysipelothrix rhusiopathiae]MDE8106768.1 hypothetical protein [Erysipelothrix rhusiopathiae]
MKDLSRTVTMNCDTCGSDQFQIDEENEFTNYTCSDCGKVYSKEKLMKLNEYKINSNINDMKDNVLKNLKKELKKGLKR